MAVYDILPTENLKWDDIRDTLNAGGGVVDNNAINAFKETSGINVWSKHKPVVLAVNFCQDFNSGAANYNSTWWQGSDGNCGLVPKTLFDFSEVIENTDGEMNGWTYNLPKGGSSQPYRLGDFAGYCKYANPPIYNLLATPNKVVYNTSTPVSISAGIRVGTDAKQLTFADFPTLKNYYFGVYCLGRQRGFKARATSTSNVGSGNAGLELDVKGLPVDTYDVYPFLAESPVAQTDPDKAMTLYTLPNLKVYQFEIVNEYELYYVTVKGSIGGTFNNEISWEVKFTVREGGTTKRFTNLRLDFRFPDKDYDDPQDVGEVRENYDIDVSASAGQTVTVKTGTTTILSTELLKDCKIWARVSNNTESYTGNNYVRG